MTRLRATQEDLALDLLLTDLKGLGLVAEQFGLRVALWLLLAGPVAVLVGWIGSGQMASERSPAHPLLTKHFVAPIK